MHLGRFNSLLNNLNIEFETLKVANLFQTLIDKLRAAVANQSNSEIANQFKTELETFRQSLNTSKFNNLRPIEKMMLDSIGAHKVIGNSLFERVMRTIESNQISPAVAIDELVKLQQEIQIYYKNISTLLSTFNSLVIEYDDIEEGGAEIGLLLPKDENKSTLGDFSKELKDWEKILNPINQTFDENRTPVQIKNCATTDWTIFLYSSVPTIYGVYLCLAAVNKVLTESLKTKELLALLATRKISTPTMDSLRSEVDTELKSELRKEADTLVDNNFKGDDGTKNELKNALSQALSRLSLKISLGAKIEVKLMPKPQKSESSEQTSDENTKKIEAYAKEINDNIEKLSFKEDLEKVRALIPFSEDDDE